MPPISVRLHGCGPPHTPSMVRLQPNPVAPRRAGYNTTVAEWPEPSPRTKMAVISLAGGVCAFSGCEKPYYDEARDQVLGRVAHIKARSPGGPRFDPLQTPSERNGVANLMALCIEHSFEIDDHPDRFSVDVLLRMRAEHDAEATDAPAQVLVRIADALGDVSTNTYRAAVASERIADAMETQARPRFEIASTPGAMDPRKFSPEWEVEQSGGQPVRSIRYRFLGQRIAAGSEGTSFKDGRLLDHGTRRYLKTKALLDLTAPPKATEWPDLGPNELGFEIQFPDVNGVWRSVQFKVPFEIVEMPNDQLRLKLSAPALRA